MRRRAGVLVVRVCGRTKDSYLLSDGDRHAHGATLAEARVSLQFKIGSRDTSKYKAWNKNTSARKEEMIVAYRVITGACEAGVRSFISTRNIPEKFTVAEAVELTRGAFGNETFAAFFK